MFPVVGVGWLRSYLVDGWGVSALVLALSIVLVHLGGVRPIEGRWLVVASFAALMVAGSAIASRGDWVPVVLAAQRAFLVAHVVLGNVVLQSLWRLTSVRAMLVIATISSTLILTRMIPPPGGEIVACVGFFGWTILAVRALLWHGRIP
jgi:hypothetical protein